MFNALTIDVEDYFQVTAFKQHVRREDWDRFPLRVVDNTARILDMLDECSIKATFFVLGWVAKRAPGMVRDIQARGHEIACHGYGHQLIYDIGPDNFRADIRMARSILEDTCGTKINGYRAPSYSITKESLWALNILLEEGFIYDSSIFPVIHDIYGMPDASRFPHAIKTSSGVIQEFPLSTVEIKVPGLTYRLPIAGGGYLRLFPVWLFKSGISRINVQERQPAVLYFHPWEMDPGQPKIKAGGKSRFRHYINLHKTEAKVRSLFNSFKFVPMGQVLTQQTRNGEPVNCAMKLMRSLTVGMTGYTQRRERSMIWS